MKNIFHKFLSLLVILQLIFGSGIEVVAKTIENIREQNSSKNKEEIIKKNSPLILKSAKQMLSNLTNGINLVLHGSHVSHTSHTSGSSHGAHFSHTSHVSSVVPFPSPQIPSIVVPVPNPQIPTNKYVTEKQIISAEYIKVIKENVNIYEEPNNTLAIVGIASEGDVFKCVEVGESFSKIILFSGKARYISSLDIIKVDYFIKVPDRDLCKEVNTLIEDVKKYTNLESKIDYLKENIKKEYNYNEYCNLLIDRNLLELFQSSDINPADYSQIIIKSKE